MGKPYVVQSHDSLMLDTFDARSIGIVTSRTTRMGHNQRTRIKRYRNNTVTITRTSDRPAKRLHRRDISRIIHTADSYSMFDTARIVALYRGRV